MSGFIAGGIAGYAALGTGAILGGAAIGGGIGSYLSAGDAADSASEASMNASQVQANSQREALAYLKQRNLIPDQIRDKSLQSLADYYKVPGEAQAPKSQQDLINEAMNSQLYASIMGTQKAGENTILRNASAVGLRSGNTAGALTDFGAQTANRALLSSYDAAQTRDNSEVARSDLERQRMLTGLGGLAQLPNADASIAKLTSDIGTTNANGIVAAGQAQQQGTQNGVNDLLGFGNLALKAYGLSKPGGTTNNTGIPEYL